MRKRDFLLVTLSLVAVACASGPAQPEGPASPTKGWIGTIVAYQKVSHESHGIVGYVKVYEYRQPGYVDSFRLHHVYDLDFRERGRLNDRGTGTKFDYLPSDVARVKGVPFEEEPLEAQPFAYNVGRCLGVEGNLKFAPATPADLKRAVPSEAAPIEVPAPAEPAEMPAEPDEVPADE